jgi:hypothetical protein
MTRLECSLMGQPRGDAGGRFCGKAAGIELPISCLLHLRNGPYRGHKPSPLQFAAMRYKIQRVQNGHSVYLVDLN